MSPLSRLRSDPTRFTFDAAVRLLEHAAGVPDAASAANFSSPPNLLYPGAEVVSVSDRRHPEIVTSVMGLVGPSGVLPRGYTELATVAERDRSHSLHDFLDLLADRFVAHFADAGAKYRPHRAAERSRLARGSDPVRAALLALVGYGGLGLAKRLSCSEAPLLHYAGFFAGHPRSADRLAALASDFLGSKVEVRQFVGAWLDLASDQQSSLPRGRGEGSFCRLGVDAAIGTRAWDVQARVVLRIGPLNKEEFEALLPGGVALGRLVGLVRAYLGFETGFAVNLVLGRHVIPPMRLGGESAPRLGWNSWMDAPPSARLEDAGDALFDAGVVEAETARRAA